MGGLTLGLLIPIQNPIATIIIIQFSGCEKFFSRTQVEFTPGQVKCFNYQ